MSKSTLKVADTKEDPIFELAVKIAQCVKDKFRQASEDGSLKYEFGLHTEFLTFYINRNGCYYYQRANDFSQRAEKKAQEIDPHAVWDIIANRIHTGEIQSCDTTGILRAPMDFEINYNAEENIFEATVPEPRKGINRYDTQGGLGGYSLLSNSHVKGLKEHVTQVSRLTDFIAAAIDEAREELDIDSLLADTGITYTSEPVITATSHHYS